MSTLTCEVVARIWREHSNCNWKSTGVNVMWSCGIWHPGPLYMQPTTRDRHVAALVMTQVTAEVDQAHAEGAAEASADLPWLDCTGAGDCPETWHWHGCFADTGQCDDPRDHHDQVRAEGAAEAWEAVADEILRAGEAGAAEVRDVLAELVDLKDGPRDADYERRKPLAWERARAALADQEADQ